MNCACGAEGRVTETRERADGSMRRTRVCVKCQERWTTIEARVPNRPRGDVHVLIISTGELHSLRTGVDALQILLNPKMRAQQREATKPQHPTYEQLLAMTQECAYCDGKGGEDDTDAPDGKAKCIQCKGVGRIPL